MRVLLIVLCVVGLVLLASAANAGPLAKSPPSGSACAGGKCAVPIEVRVERAVVAEKTKAVVKTVAVKTEAAVEKVGKGRLKKLIGKLIHRRGK